MPRMDKLSNYKTTIHSKNGNTCIVYQNTCIVEFDRECIILRTGGWRTVTTKRKMQQASNQFDLGFRVWQDKYNWYVQLDGGRVIPFDGDSVVIDRASKLPLNKAA